MIPSPDLLPDEPMPAPQRPMRRAPQDAQNNAATRGASSTASRRRTDDNAEKRRPMLPATCRIRVFPATPPPARFRSLTFSRQPRFRRLRADRRASPNALSEATFIRVRSTGLQFSARLRSSRAQPPPCFRSPRGFRLLPRAPRAPCSPRSIPRAFSCAFPALLPHSIPPFCASFVKKHHEACAAAQNLCNAAHLRALRPGLRSNCPATFSAGRSLPT